MDSNRVANMGGYVWWAVVVAALLFVVWITWIVRRTMAQARRQRTSQAEPPLEAPPAKDSNHRP